MKKVQHTAFYITRDGDKEWLINNIREGKPFDFALPLDGLSGEIFSDSILQYFLNEELKHDNFEIKTGNNIPLSNSSGGEQRKALLSYLIGKNPDYLIIDNVFESLDKGSTQSISLRLKELAANTLIIQIFSRKSDLLPFMETIYTIESRSVITKLKRGLFMTEKQPITKDQWVSVIPPPLRVHSPHTGTLIKMNNVNVQYDGKPVLQNICWEINAGEFWHLTGPNGSGKTTLVSLITGNNSKGYGQDMLLFGRRKGTGETVWEIKEKIGYFTPSMTLQFERPDSIEQMIISGFFDSVGLYLKPSGRQVELAGEWLSLMGMYNYKNKPFQMVSSIDKRMVMIARAMVKHPPLLILDEPTAGLDDAMAGLFVSLINKIASETATTILYVSHRDETGLLPGRIFSLSPDQLGSTGIEKFKNVPA